MHTLPIAIHAAAAPVVRAAANSGTVLSGVVTADMMNGVLDEIIGVLPVCLPVLITFIGIRKGISFVIGILRSA